MIWIEWWFGKCCLFSPIGKVSSRFTSWLSGPVSICSSVSPLVREILHCHDIINLWITFLGSKKTPKDPKLITQRVITDLVLHFKVLCQPFYRFLYNWSVLWVAAGWNWKRRLRSALVSRSTIYSLQMIKPASVLSPAHCGCGYKCT